MVDGYSCTPGATRASALLSCRGVVGLLKIPKHIFVELNVVPRSDVAPARFGHRLSHGCRILFRTLIHQLQPPLGLLAYRVVACPIAEIEGGRRMGVTPRLQKELGRTLDLVIGAALKNDLPRLDDVLIHLAAQCAVQQANRSRHLLTAGHEISFRGSVG